MTQLIFDDRAMRELRRQCLHHNVAPIFIGRYLEPGELPRVYSVLKPIFDRFLEQLLKMSFNQTKQVVDSIPAGFRMLLQPVVEPITTEYLCRVAEYCIASEIQKGYSPISAILRPNPDDSEVLACCPELRSEFDDDGLLRIDERFEMLDGGVRYGEYMLHYHQFLRRGFSSNPNFDFLGALSRYRRNSGLGNSFRVAIDHRRIMRFEDYRQLVEMDAWFGPKFDRAKLDDPAYVGLTVVGRIHPNSLDSYQLEKTEFLWKTNEGEAIKTLEIEELSCPSRPRENWHINRYLHAQRDTEKRVFRHFDGAARIYVMGSYQERMEQAMPRNAKSTHYVKLFRIDGSVDLDDWLSLTSMFYKGNEMIIEYFDPVLFDRKIRPMRESMYEALHRLPDLSEPEKKN